MGRMHHARSHAISLRGGRVSGTHLQIEPRWQGPRRWLGKSGKQLKQFGWIHEIACPSENEIYVGELLNWRVQKLILEPAK